MGKKDREKEMVINELKQKIKKKQFGKIQMTEERQSGRETE